MADGRLSCFHGLRRDVGAAAILAKGGRMTWMRISTGGMDHRRAAGCMWRKAGNCGNLWRMVTWAAASSKPAPPRPGSYPNKVKF